MGELSLRGVVAAERQLQRDPVARRASGLGEQGERHVAGALLADCDDLDPVTDPRPHGRVQGREVLGVAHRALPLQRLKAVEDPTRDLRGARPEAVGQQGALISIPPRLTLV